MAINKREKITLDMLMQRAAQSKNAKPVMKTYYSEELGGELELVRLPLVEYLEMTDEFTAEDSNSSIANYEYIKKTIYKHCRMLQNKGLQEAYECAEPYDIVPTQITR